MNEIEWIKSKDQHGDATSGDIDVTDSVLREIRLRKRAAESPSAFPLAAIFATLAGTAMAILALQMWLNFSDPLTDLTSTFSLVLQ